MGEGGGQNDPKIIWMSPRKLCVFWKPTKVCRYGTFCMTMKLLRYAIVQNAWQLPELAPFSIGRGQTCQSQTVSLFPSVVYFDLYLFELDVYWSQGFFHILEYHWLWHFFYKRFYLYLSQEILCFFSHDFKENTKLF